MVQVLALVLVVVQDQAVVLVVLLEQAQVAVQVAVLVMVQLVKKAKRIITETTQEMEITLAIIRVILILMASLTASQMISHKAIQTVNLIMQKITVRMLVITSLIISHKIKLISLN